jgi:hypothetical protein
MSFFGLISLAAANLAIAQTVTITGFAPTSGPVNRVVVFSGTNFLPPPSATPIITLFNGIPSPWIENSGTQILVPVPAGATSGPITVQNALGSATSTDSFVLAPVGIPPPNDNFSNAQMLVGSSGFVIGNTAYATKEPGEPNIAGNAGGASVWFTWTAPSNGLYLFDPFGTGSWTPNQMSSDFGVLLGIYTGLAVNTLTPVASGSCTLPFGFSPQMPFFTNAAVLDAVAGATYYIAIDGYNGLMGDYYLAWSPLPAPTIKSFRQCLQTTGNLKTDDRS